MDSIEYHFLAMYSNSGPSIHMGDDLDIQAKGIDRIDLENGCFNNFLFVPNLGANLLLVYQMTHTGESKRVKFTPEIVEIEEISTNKVVALGFDDHARIYKLSHFLPYSRGNALMSHSNETSRLWHEGYGHIKYKHL